MKQKDIAMIIVVAVVAAVFSLVIARFAFVRPQDKKMTVEVVEAISTEFPLPDTKYFNANSINPTQLIQIAENSNNTPFNAIKR